MSAGRILRFVGITGWGCNALGLAMVWHDGAPLSGWLAFSAIAGCVGTMIWLGGEAWS